MTDTSLEPWQWPEDQWRRIVGVARAGRSMAPASWPGGARCAVAISFDADHDTIPLRDSDESPMRISQGQYGNRQAVPRIRRLLEREGVPASFFYPAVSALLYPDEVRAVAAEYRLNPLTVLKGYQQLVDENLVEKRRGRGMYVSDGARKLLLAGERERFLNEEWPQTLAVINRLGFSQEELFAQTPASTHPAPPPRGSDNK